jgi:hypothetical protein
MRPAAVDNPRQNGTRSPFHTYLVLAALILNSTATSTVWAGSDDLLDPGRFAKRVGATKDLSGRLGSWVDSLRAAIAGHQWEYGKRTNEGRLWQGGAPGVKDLHELEQATRRRTDAFLDSIRILLDKKQEAKLNRILKKNDLLKYSIAAVPFHHINNSPMSPRFDAKAGAYKVTVPGELTAAANWSYGDLLDTWTVNKYVRLPDAAASQSLTAAPDVQVAANSPTLRSLILRSPLIIAATLMTPDLAKAELDVLFDHYPHTFANRESAWESYVSENKLDEYIVLRLKMSTPLSAYYLSPDRYIIFLEDAEGTGYEPSTIDKNPIRKLEALEIQVPGQTATYTDVFGTYTGRPGYKETRTISRPGKIRYTGRERLLKLYFPSKDFEGTPIVNPKTRQLKLVVQPELENLPRMELMWEMKKNPKASK